MVFRFFKFTFLIISIAGNESNFTIKESMVMFPKNSTKRSKIDNDIDGDGDGDDDDDENGEGIKCYLKMVLCFKDLPLL
jgi:hypothetical protein